VRRTCKLWVLWYPINNFLKVFLCEVINGQNKGILTSFWEADGETEGSNWNENFRPSSPFSLVLAYGKDLWRDTQNVPQKLPGRRYRLKKVSSFRANPLPHPPHRAGQVVRQPKSACRHPVGTRLEQKRSIEPKPLKLPVGSPRLCKCYGFPHWRAL